MVSLTDYANELIEDCYGDSLKNLPEYCMTENRIQSFVKLQKEAGRCKLLSCSGLC